MLPKIAIIGRPNVGKSTLFNRLAGRRLALVDPSPGLTRDRRAEVIDLDGRQVELIDTAGLEEAASETVTARMRAQSERALREADLILFVIDVRDGVTPADETFALVVRQSGRPVLLVANKCEGRQAEDALYETFSLGFGEAVAISAEHGLGIGDLFEAIEERLPAPGEPESEPRDPARSTEQGGGEAGQEAGATREDEPENERYLERPLKLAIVGRPNAGKSTLVNTLLGEERMITGPEAGITRDTIATLFTYGGRQILLHDTAGLRRKSRIHERVEKLSVGDAINAIRFAEIVVLLVDLESPLDKQELQIAELVAKEGRGLVIALNKWDIVEDHQAHLKFLREEIDRLLPQVRGIPVLPISGLSGRGVAKLMQAVADIERNWNRRIATSALNRWLEDATHAHPPPAASGRRIRMRYMTQPNARPPTFIVFCSKAENVPESYKRYLINGLRETFELWGVPIRLHLRRGDNPYA